MRIAKRWHFLAVLLSSFVGWLVAITPLCAEEEVDKKALFTEAEAEPEVDEKALEILDKTSAYYQALENFKATYVLTIKYPEEDTIQCDKIKMQITARGQQYRLSYGQKETITDGETVWAYDKELKEVTISEYAKTDADLNLTELYNLYQQGYRFVYIGARVVHKAKKIIRDIVQLTPLREDSSFKHITLEVDRATAQIHSWEVVQNEETRYICTINKFSVNIPLSDDYFTFDISAHGDLEVIDLRESEEEVDLDEV
ncbi:LolA family protein [Cardinium endosymbiont of Nabis limbatus]|uniref:LolA family protein n=1 Tax=Cardinium endosymbiont of Nabis limbatus TaxID=3066217 RepID=UPI003AF3A271